MHRLARIALSLVAVFAAVVVLTVYAKRQPLPSETAAATSNADLMVKEVNIREEQGKIRWHLTAEQALVFEQEGRTTLKKIAVLVEQPERSWTIVGQEGDLFQKHNDVEIRHNVVVTSSDGVRLETDVLRFQGNEKRLWTDTPITLSREGSTIRGSGLEVQMNDETTVIKGRVRARFFLP